MVCKALRNYGITRDIDVHLMVSPVDSMIQEFAKAGASYITFHPEATNHVDRSLSLIKSNGLKAGLALKPSTSLEHCKYVLDKLDILLLMSVNPGFGGQAFIPTTYQVSYNITFHSYLHISQLRRFLLTIMIENQRSTSNDRCIRIQYSIGS
jgi:ribulose-phosphate 3-epimerase